MQKLGGVSFHWERGWLLIHPMVMLILEALEYIPEQMFLMGYLLYRLPVCRFSEQSSHRSPGAEFCLGRDWRPTLTRKFWWDNILDEDRRRQLNWSLTFALQTRTYINSAYLKQVSEYSQDTIHTDEINRSKTLFCNVCVAGTFFFPDYDGWCIDLSVVYVGISTLVPCIEAFCSSLFCLCRYRSM